MLNNTNMAGFDQLVVVVVVKFKKKNNNFNFGMAPNCIIIFRLMYFYKYIYKHIPLNIFGGIIH